MWSLSEGWKREPGLAWISRNTGKNHGVGLVGCVQSRQVGSRNGRPSSGNAQASTTEGRKGSRWQREEAQEAEALRRTGFRLRRPRVQCQLMAAGRLSAEARAGGSEGPKGDNPVPTRGDQHSEEHGQSQGTGWWVDTGHRSPSLLS